MASTLLFAAALLGGCTDPDPTDSADTAADTGDTATPSGPAWNTAFDTEGLGALSGVWGSAPDDVFVVGGTPERADILHYDGSDWTPMEAPDVPLLVWVYGFGPDDVYAVGVGGGFVHWDGQSWSELESGTDEDLWGIWGRSGDELVIVGGDIDEGEPVLLHWDGSEATPYTLDEKQNPRGALSLFKVWGTGDTVFALGQRGLVLQWDGQDWAAVSAGAEADDDFVSLWGTGEDQIVAVGGRSNARVATWDGASWTTEAPRGVPGLNAVTLTSADEAIVGGISGFMGRVDLATGQVESEGVLTAMDLHAAWHDGEGRVWMVGGRFYEPYEGVALVREDP